MLLCTNRLPPVSHIAAGEFGSHCKGLLAQAEHFRDVRDSVFSLN